MAVNIYVYFNGNCREVVEYYAQAFGTEKPRIMAFGDTPPNPDYPLPEEAKNLVLHTNLNIGGSIVMFSDVFPGSPFTAGNNINLSLLSKNIDELKTWFTNLKQDGKVTMELQETFFSKCHGSLTDKYGISWQFTHDNGQMGM